MRILPPPDPTQRPLRRLLEVALVVAAALLIAEALFGVLSTPASDDQLDIDFGQRALAPGQPALPASRPAV